MGVIRDTEILKALQRMRERAEYATEATEGMIVVASMLNSVIGMDEEEFHVHTPKDDGGAKKKKKYGWLENNPLEWDDADVPSTPKGVKRSLEAIFIAQSVAIAHYYAREL